MATINQLVQDQLGVLMFRLLALQAERDDLQHRLAAAQLELAKSRGQQVPTQLATPGLE